MALLEQAPPGIPSARQPCPKVVFRLEMPSAPAYSVAVKPAILLALFVLCIPAAHGQTAKVVTGKDGIGTLVFPDCTRFETTLYHLKVIGKLNAAHKLPYFILSGVGCTECDANVAIYIHSPSIGPMHGEGSQQRFYCPGQESD